VPGCTVGGAEALPRSGSRQAAARKRQHLRHLNRKRNYSLTPENTQCFKSTFYSTCFFIT
jgi:hypothetical protein